MATYKGNDLIISDESGALAASKSCTLTVSADTSEYSHPDSGPWQHNFAGKKAWKLSTTHLVKASAATDTPLKEAIARVGNSYTLTFTVRDYVNDTVSGTAICQTFKVTATRGNLLQGSFEWTGDGPLE